MNRGKVELTSFTKANGAYTFEYLVEQDNGVTTVHQVLTIRGIDGLSNWIADIKLEGFQPQKTPADAAIKMADWLSRLAAAIRIGDYMELQRAEFKDLDDCADALAKMNEPGIIRDDS